MDYLHKRDRHRKHLVQLLLLLAALLSSAVAELCDITSSQPAIILDLPESIGNQTDQSTTPEELPLEGTPDTDIILSLSSEGQHFFNLTGKRLLLLKPLDRDKDDLSTIRFTVQCRAQGRHGARSVPVVVRLVDRNDNVPKFVSAPYSVNVPESTPVGATVFSGIGATDADAGVNGQIRYSIVPGDGGPTDGYGILVIPLPHQGHVTVARELDYEESRVLVVNIQAADNSATNQQKSITTLTVRLEDSDDQDPEFVLSSCHPGGADQQSCPTPEYSASVTAGRREGVMNVLPERIHAIDKDSLSAPIRYTLSSGDPPSYRQFLSMDPRSAALSQIAPVPRGLTDAFILQVKAEEQSPRKGSVFATLTVTVKNPDSAMPVVSASAHRGEVMENSPPGTEVLTEAGEHIILSVSDPDLLPGEAQPSYRFELTTGAFKVTPDGVLVVAVPGLDRDAPSPPTHTFQIVAREVSPKKGSAASSPITVTVKLLDDNDHSPRFPVYPPVVVAAGSTHRTLTKVVAQDPDEGINGALQYQLVGVSGGSGGLAKFLVDADTGEVRLVGIVTAGETYTLKINADDGGGRSGSMLLEVRVDRGPNTGGPYFPRRQFSTIVPEDTLPGTAVIRLKAVDPDGDVPRYSLHAMVQKKSPSFIGRQEEEHLPFQVDPLSGEVTLSEAVDREMKDKYIMVITAEDDEGLRGSVTLDVIIADVNDERPQFQDLPYSYRVLEGKEGFLLGIVKATDADEDRSGLVEYSMPADAPLSVGPYNGTVYTKVALDYEKQQVHYVVVTATDGGRPPLSSTTTLTLLVGDVSDEPPVFPQTTYTVEISEAIAIGSLVTTVLAKDPDSKPSVTYAMKSFGKESRMFGVNPDTGRITVTGLLDRETTKEYVLVIGTLENKEDEKGSVSRVIITILDENDATPVMRPMAPVLVSLDTPPGTVLVTVVATDDDATTPNNKISYELQSEDPVSEYISIDKETGDIRLVKKLAELNVTEVQLEVIARDGGSPPRSSSTPLLVLVEVEGAPPPRIIVPPTFSRSQVFVSIREDMAVGGMIARVGIINPPANPICTLLEPTESYRAVLTESGDCGVELKAEVDADKISDRNSVFTLQLFTDDQEYTTPDAIAKINITVQDVNDNSPRFYVNDKKMFGEEDHADEIDIDKSSPLKRKNNSVMYRGAHTLFVTVSDDTSVGHIVIQLNATDRDSGTNGDLRFSLVPRSNRGGYFAVEPLSGRLVTARGLSDVPQGLTPFNLTVLVEDSPMEAKHRKDEAHVIVNVISGEHRLVIPIRAPLEHVQQRRPHILQAFADRDDAIVVMERIVEAKPKHQTFRDQQQQRPLGSEVWLALMDPNTGELLPRSHPRVNRVMSQPSDSPGSLQYALLKAVGDHEMLHQEETHQDVVRQRTAVGDVYSVFGGTALSDGGPETMIATAPGLQLGLVILAVTILFLGLISILYICIHWARAVRDREKMAGVPILRVPIMHHPASSSITDTLHKQYEVQVLHMSVPLDDDSMKDITPQRSTQNFFMDNVSYISKNNQMVDDSRSDAGHPGMDDSPRWGMGHPSTSTGGGAFPPNGSISLRRPPTHGGGGYHHQQDSSDSEDIDMNGSSSPLSHSATNHNVMFGRRVQETDNDYQGGNTNNTRYHPGNGNTYNGNNSVYNGGTGDRHHNGSNKDGSNASYKNNGYQSNHNSGESTRNERDYPGFSNYPEDRGAGSGGGVMGRRSSRNEANINGAYNHEEDDGVMGYGFEGAGMGDPAPPILDLSPVQTTTLL